MYTYSARKTILSVEARIPSLEAKREVKRRREASKSTPTVIVTSVSRSQLFIVGALASSAL